MTARQVSPDKFVESMQQEMQQYLQSVMKAVNNAPDGDRIGGEKRVRDLSADFRRQEFGRRRNQLALRQPGPGLLK